MKSRKADKPVTVERRDRELGNQAAFEKLEAVAPWFYCYAEFRSERLVIEQGGRRQVLVAETENEFDSCSGFHGYTLS